MNRVDVSNLQRVRKLARRHDVPLIRLSELGVPKTCRFPDLTGHLVDLALKNTGTRNKTSNAMVLQYKKVATALLEGLYQAYWCSGQHARLALPISRTSYCTKKSKRSDQISAYGQTAVLRVIAALESLDMIEKSTGGLTAYDESVMTTLCSKGALLDRFKEMPFVWQWMPFPEDRALIILRDDDPNPPKGKKRKKRPKIRIHFEETSCTRRMKKRLLMINRFWSDHAICLDLDEPLYQWIGTRMAQRNKRDKNPYGDEDWVPRPLNIANIWIHRVFSRGCFTKGGRHYGPWWQQIPKDFRKYILIDGQPTCEIDFSGLHPRIMYASSGLPIPDGDLYDLRLSDKDTVLDPNGSNYKEKRKIIKKYINSKINDEKGRFRLSKDEYKTLGLNAAQLRNRMLKKHPILKDYLKTGCGLDFQYLDSEMAEAVMLKLMAQEIVCLPMFDSFIVQNQFEEELKQAMMEAFAEQFGQTAALSDVEKLEVDDHWPPRGFKIDYAKDELPDYNTPIYPTDFNYLKNRATSGYVPTYLSTFWSHHPALSPASSSAISGQTFRQKSLKAKTSKE